MMRGTFGNIRLQSQLVPGSTGGITHYFPTGETMSIYDAAMNYQKNEQSCIILAGKDYGMGSSRDWAAKGTNFRRQSSLGRKFRTDSSAAIWS